MKKRLIKKEYKVFEGKIIDDGNRYIPSGQVIINSRKLVNYIGKRVKVFLYV